MDSTLERMSPPPGNPFTRDFEHSDALFEAAVAEFVAQGYDQASINTILAAANMSKGQFYYHFGSKEALYFALIELLIAQKQAFLQAVMRPEDFSGDIFDIFQAQIRHGMAFARAHPAINRFSESFLRERGNPIYKKAMTRYNFEANEGINALIDAAHRRGDFREDLPPPFIRKVIGYLFTHVAELADLDRVDAVEDDLRHLIEFMRAGLAA